MTPYEKTVIEEAENWFSVVNDLLVWDWDHDEPGRCHPLNVVSAWEDGRSLPSQVRRRESDFLRQILVAEWERSGMPIDSIPEIESWADGEGRRVWHVDLSDEVDEAILHAFGRALLRDAAMPAWDFEWENLIYPEYSKTWVISLDDGEYVYEPTEAAAMGVVEGIREFPDRPSYFCLLQQRSSYLQASRYPEGAVVSMRVWRDLGERRFTHWRASVAPPSGCEVTLDDLKVDESDLVPWSEVGPLALAVMANPNEVPDRPRILWRVVEGTEPQCT